MKRTVSVAPMMDCTDRHDRFFLRLISKNVMLYSEMIATKSAIHGDRKKYWRTIPKKNPQHFKSEDLIKKNFRKCQKQLKIWDMTK